MARPRKELTAEQLKALENYARLGGTNGEIASMLDMSTDTLERRFAAVLAKGRASRRLRLRQLQWQSAEKGNVAMQIFLGKNELGQADEPAQAAEGEKRITLSFVPPDLARRAAEAVVASSRERKRKPSHRLHSASAMPAADPPATTEGSS